MKVSCTFTLNELQRITPNLRKEHFFSECPKVKEALYKLFWNLGCELPDKPDIVEGVVTKNRFDELDQSPRISVHERLDSEWISSIYSSHRARLFTEDVGMMQDLDKITNLRSYEVCNEKDI